MQASNLNTKSGTAIVEGAVQLEIHEAEIQTNGPTFAVLKVTGTDGRVASARVAIKVTTQGVRFQLVAKKNPEKGQLQPHCIREATGDWMEVAAPVQV